jgi:hypothetical protein
MTMTDTPRTTAPAMEGDALTAEQTTWTEGLRIRAMQRASGHGIVAMDVEGLAKDAIWFVGELMAAATRAGVVCDNGCHRQAYDLAARYRALSTPTDGASDEGGAA